MIKLKIRRKGVGGIFHPFFAKKVGLSFEHYAFFFAWDYHNLEPWQFEKLEYDVKLITIVLGAAKWWCMQNQKKADFGYNDIERALMSASMETNKEIGKLMTESTWPKWLTSEGEGGVKKKSQRKQ